MESPIVDEEEKNCISHPWLIDPGTGQYLYVKTHGQHMNNNTKCLTSNRIVLHTGGINNVSVCPKPVVDSRHQIVEERTAVEFIINEPDVYTVTWLEMTKSMMLPAPTFGDRNRHSSNGDFGYNRQYPYASRGHFPNYWHGCDGTTCGPPHHWDDSHSVDRTYQAPTKCIKVLQNRDNSLISGRTPEGMKHIHGSDFNHSKDSNTPRLPYYGMPPAGNNSYNGVNSQHGCPQRRSPSPLYVNHNCDGGNRWNGQNHSCNQQQQPPPSSSKNTITIF